MSKKSKKPMPSSTTLTEPSRLYARSYAARLAKQVSQEVAGHRPAPAARAPKKARA